MIRVLVTRPRKQAEAFAGQLREAGFEPVYFPVIEIQSIRENLELDRALENLEHYDWIVFTSANGVAAVMEQAGDRLEAKPLPRLAAIGPETAKALRGRGLQADFIPEEYVAEAILPGLGPLRNKWVLFPQAEIARRVLPQAIAMQDGIAHEIAVYRTLPTEVDAGGLEALRQGVDVVTLTSPSAAQNFVSIARSNGLDPEHLPGDPRFVCIGPVTLAAAEEAGLPKLSAAGKYTAQGLVEHIRALAVGSGQEEG